MKIALHGLVLLLVLALGGCAEWYSVKNGVGSHMGKIADEELKTTLWLLCNGSSKGAHDRRFQTQEDIIAVKVVCKKPLMKHEAFNIIP